MTVKELKMLEKGSTVFVNNGGMVTIQKYNGMEKIGGRWHASYKTGTGLVCFVLPNAVSK